MVTLSRSSCNRSRRSHLTFGRGFAGISVSSRQSFLNTLGKTLSWATAPIIEENNPRFFAGHVGVGGDDVMPASRSDISTVRNSFSVTAKSPSTTTFSSEPAKCRPSVHPHCIIKIDAVDLGRMSEGELDHSLFGDKPCWQHDFTMTQAACSLRPSYSSPEK